MITTTLNNRSTSELKKYVLTLAHLSSARTNDSSYNDNDNRTMSTEGRAKKPNTTTRHSGNRLSIGEKRAMKTHTSSVLLAHRSLTLVMTRLSATGNAGFFVVKLDPKFPVYNRRLKTLVHEHFKLMQGPPIGLVGSPSKLRQSVAMPSRLAPLMPSSSS